MIPQKFNKIDRLYFAGKVVNRETGEWVNDRLVLLFLKGVEIDRVVTQTTEIDIFERDNQYLFEDKTAPVGISDGLFAVSASNTYQLLYHTLGVDPRNLSLFEAVIDPQYLGKMLVKGTYVLAAWMDPLFEGETREFFIPSKQIRYTIVVLPGDVSQLPAEIQQPGSVALGEGNRLVAVNPGAPHPEPQAAFTNTMSRFEQVAESVIEFSPVIFPINNCGGGADIQQQVTQTFLHEIVDESRLRLGVEIPVKNWAKISAEIERHYGITDQQITTYATTLIVPAGQNIQYTIVRKQIWESGVVVLVSEGVEIYAPYRILKGEAFEVKNSEQKDCP